MNLIYLAIDDLVRLEFKGTDIPIKLFSSFLSYTKDRVPAVGFIVDTDNEEKGRAVLKELRKTP